MCRKYYMTEDKNSDYWQMCRKHYTTEDETLFY